MGNLREHDVHAAVIQQLGFAPGAIHHLAKSDGVPYGFLRDNRRIPASRLHTAILDAYDAAGRQNGNNNVVAVTPDAHNIGAALVLNKNHTHMLGMGPPGRMNLRTRLSQGAAFTPFITISGYGNYFKRLYFMHGTAEADYVGFLISGARNVFENVHFAGPQVAAIGGHANYIGVHITGSENYFKDCQFGFSTMARDEATPNVQIGANVQNTVFENCIFSLALTDGDPLFLKVLNTSGMTEAYFKNCTFVAFSSNWATAMTKAIECTGGSTCGLYFDALCNFVNVTAICDTTDDAYVFMASPGDAAATAYTGHAVRGLGA